MKVSKSSWILSFIILIGASSSVFGDQRIQLVQGRREVKDKVTFTIDVLRAKNQNPQYENAPAFIQMYVTFDQATTGMVYVDGKPIGRFDESRVFNSNQADITYGRHTVAMVITRPSVVSQFFVTVPGADLREFLSVEAVLPAPVGLEPRVVVLERKVQELEAELAGMKKQKAVGKKQ